MMPLVQVMGANDTTPPTASFIKSLYQMTRAGSPHITWSADGKTFRIVDIERFSAEVLPRFFKHRNMASFQRQLNYFSFRKATKTHRTMGKTTDVAEFYHPWFYRDIDECDLPYFRRKTNNRFSIPMTRNENKNDSNPELATTSPKYDRVTPVSSVQAKGASKILSSFNTADQEKLQPPSVSLLRRKRISKRTIETSDAIIQIPTMNINPITIPRRLQLRGVQTNIDRSNLNSFTVERNIDIHWGEVDSSIPTENSIAFPLTGPFSTRECEWLNTFDLDYLHDSVPFFRGGLWSENDFDPSFV